jgi:ubiquinone/menaquinone biosynthesis C-methylase UbiE
MKTNPHQFLLMAALVLSQLPASGQESAPAQQSPPGEQSSPVDSDRHASSSGYHKKFNDAGEWAKKFDDPERDKWQKPQEVIRALKINAEDKIADLGAGTGYFAFRIARECPKAIIYAADVEPDMVRYLKKKSREQKLDNVVAVETPANELVLPAKVNLVIVVDTYHHIDDRVSYFKKLKELLLPGGRLAIVDFTKASPMGPPVEHRIGKEKVTAELGESGFDLNDDLDLLPNQHFLIFRIKPVVE